VLTRIELIRAGGVAPVLPEPSEEVSEVEAAAEGTPAQ
jgi:hypothetical protein